MLLDIGVGILAALWLGQPVWLGILFSLLPDFDMLVSLVKYRGNSGVYKHRDLLHLPIIYIAIGTALYFYDPRVAALFLICTMLHFVHDSIGLGWGVQWLWPISRDHFSFLYLYQPPGKPALPKKYFYRFPHGEMAKLDAEFGDPNWVHNIYVQLHPFSLVELAVFSVAIAILLSI